MDLELLREKALIEGLPYQTLMSSVLHKYVTGRLTDKNVKTNKVRLCERSEPQSEPFAGQARL